MPIGVATPTIGLNAVVPFSYQGSGGVMALNFGFIPSACVFYTGTASWSWVRGMAFGQASIASGSFGSATTPVAAVLDILDGSGAASANTATTSQVIGLLIGTNTVVNNAGLGDYRGLVYR